MGLVSYGQKLLIHSYLDVQIWIIGGCPQRVFAPPGDGLITCLHGEHFPRDLYHGGVEVIGELLNVQRGRSNDHLQVLPSS